LLNDNAIPSLCLGKRKCAIIELTPTRKRKVSERIDRANKRTRLVCDEFYSTSASPENVAIDSGIIDTPAAVGYSTSVGVELSHDTPISVVYTRGCCENKESEICILSAQLKTEKEKSSNRVNQYDGLQRQLANVQNSLHCANADISSKNQKIVELEQKLKTEAKLAEEKDKKMVQQQVELEKQEALRKRRLDSMNKLRKQVRDLSEKRKTRSVPLKTEVEAGIRKILAGFFLEAQVTCFI
jgi:hypothetical protein